MTERESAQARQHRVVKTCILPLLLLLGTRCLGTVAITTTSLPNGTVSTTYSAVVNASNGCTPYKWTIASGTLPAGVTMKPSSSTTALNFTGTPTTAATSPFTVKVTGCGGNTSQMAYKVVIQATSGTLAITTTSLPNGTVGTAYSAIIKASGGCTPYKWTIASGALPAGTTAKASSTTTSLNLTGTPTAAATYSFTVKVTSCNGGTSQMAYKVVIQASDPCRGPKLERVYFEQRHWL